MNSTQRKDWHLCIPLMSLIAFLLCLTGCAGLARSSKARPTKEDFHLFLLAGQSNMAGRGAIEAQDLEVHPRVFVLSQDGSWRPAVAPLHYDKPKVVGVGLGRSFALALAERDPSIRIGLVPAACGGSPIASWVPGGYHRQTKSHPYDDAIQRTRLAMQSGVLKGILWHQGESDCKPEASQVYQEKLEALIERFREDLNMPSVPFVLGQLGRFSERAWGSEDGKHVNLALARVAQENPHVALVSSEGLTPNPDNTHFNATSLREFGRRYAAAYFDLIGAQDTSTCPLVPQVDEDGR